MEQLTRPGLRRPPAVHEGLDVSLVFVVDVVLPDVVGLVATDDDDTRDEDEDVDQQDRYTNVQIQIQRGKLQVTAFLEGLLM